MQQRQHRGPMPYIERDTSWMYFNKRILLEAMRPDLPLLERFVSQSPPALLLAPRWGWKNHEFTAKIRKALTATLQDSPK